MCEVKEICMIVDEIRNTNSMNEKVKILEKNKDNELLKKVLLYTYDYKKQYKMTSDKLPKVENIAHLSPIDINDVFIFLDKCCKKEALTDKDKYTFVNMLSYYDDEVIELFKCIIDKDLRAGINVNIINKAMGDIIEKFEVMLAENMDKLEKFLEQNDEFFIEYKYDGVRLITFIDIKNRYVEFWSRNGRKYDLPFLEKDILYNFDFDKLRLKHNGIKKIMLDGELVLGNNDFNAIMQIAKRKNIDEKMLSMLKSIKYYIFDCVINNDYNSILRNRKTWLCSMFIEYGLVNTSYCKYVEYWNGKTKNDIMNDLKSATNKGYEGLILKSSESVYEKGRSIDWIKVKEFDTIDAIVLDVETGTGALKDIVAKLKCSYYNEKLDKDIIFYVGSGLNDKLRKEWTEDKNKIIGKVIEVKYQEIFEDGAPRFPVYIKIRDDK